MLNGLGHFSPTEVLSIVCPLLCFIAQIFVVVAAVQTPMAHPIPFSTACLFINFLINAVPESVTH